MRVVAALVDSGAPVNAANVLGRTPLHLATSSESHGAVTLLLQLGANASAIDARGQSPLHLAAALANFQIIEALVNGGARLAAYTYDTADTPLSMYLASSAPEKKQQDAFPKSQSDQSIKRSESMGEIGGQRSGASSPPPGTSPSSASRDDSLERSAKLGISKGLSPVIISMLTFAEDPLVAAARSGDLVAFKRALKIKMKDHGTDSVAEAVTAHARQASNVEVF